MLPVFLMSNTFFSREDKLAKTMLSKADPVAKLFNSPSVLADDVSASLSSPRLPAGLDSPLT